MAFKQSPNLVASGAMGIVTGLAIAGGLVFALSLPAMAERTQDTASPLVRMQHTQPISLPATSHRTAIAKEAEATNLRTFGNSTARSHQLDADRAPAAGLVSRERGEVVALRISNQSAYGPQS